ncbi:general substrate transporter [Mycena alexandri]|uniref:General substrate transporter n=1 Tax=Mycena alexandri TaxID=1745969 RepID=A0AAD6SPS6_9AGAR|nr:general substrate transporter [Mycena alexandri]
MNLTSRFTQAVKPKVYTIRYPRKLLAGKPLLYLSSASASLGDALLGYSQGITAVFQVQPSFIRCIYGKHATIKQIKDGTTGIHPLQPAILILCLGVPAIFAALFSAYLSDWLGRRTTIRIGALFYLIASCIQMIAPDFATLIAGRSIQGLGAGILSTTVPIFQVEIAPVGARGMLAGLEALCMNVGYAASAWVGYAFFVDAHAENSWRGLLAVQAAVSFVLVICSFLLPESPRFLIQHGFKTEGLWTLADLHARGDVTDEGVNQTYDAIVDTLEMERRAGDGTGTVAPWRAVRNYPRRTLISTTSRMFAQFNGINAILHFLPEHLAQAGFDIPHALFFAACSSLVYSLGPLPAILFIDKLGRRRFLIVGSIALACSLTLIGFLQLYVDHWPKTLAYLGGARGVFIGMSLYLFFFGATWGPVPWLLSAELFPLRMRAKGMALSTASDWFFECVVALASTPLFDALNGAYYFLLAGACVFSGLVVWRGYVETRGKPLEAIAGMFGDAMPPPRQLEQEDAVLRVRRRRVRGRSTVSMTSQITAVASSTAGTSQFTLQPPAAEDAAQVKRSLDAEKDAEAAVELDQPPPHETYK